VRRIAECVITYGTHDPPFNVRQVTGLTVQYMDVYAGALQRTSTELEEAMQASKDFMRKCLEVDLEMERMRDIAVQAGLINDDLDRFELIVDRLCGLADEVHGAQTAPGGTP